MDILTGLDEMNLEICYHLEINDIATMYTVCKYFSEKLDSNIFWTNYLKRTVENFFTICTKRCSDNSENVGKKLIN